MASCGKVAQQYQAYLDGELGASERTVFEQHVKGCAACREQLAAHKQTSASLIEAFAEVRLTRSLQAQVLAHLPEMDYYGEHHPVWQPQYKPVRFQRLRTLAPALAPILVLIFGITLIYAWPSAELDGVQAIGMVTHAAGDVAKAGPDGADWRGVALTTGIHAEEQFETGPGATLMLALAGPTLLKVGPNTKFSVHDDRKVSLDAGHVWFDVAKDDRTFIVQTPSGEVTVFGTSFDVSVEDARPGMLQRMTVTVASGEVQVGSGADFRRLRPGQRVQVSRGQRGFVPQEVDLRQAMAWAEAIQPSVAVSERFVRREVIAADEDNWDQPFFVGVDPEEEDLTTLVLTWKRDAFSTGHTGYLVYVEDIRRNPIVQEHIPGEFFDHGESQTYAIKVPAAETLANAGDLRILCIADRTGRHPVRFSDPLLSN